MKYKPEQRKPVFSKVFRWQPEAGKPLPQTVEVAGTFTDWKRVPMLHDHAGQGWHLTLHQIPSNRTHHYMFIADGVPVQDKHCDGLAIPQGEQEQAFAITTPRGPRLFMLFAQTK